MKDQNQLLWESVRPLLKKAKRKDFILHTKNVVRAMNELLESEKGDPKILIPAACLHDVGWSGVDDKLQTSTSKDDQSLALHQHIDFAPNIIRPLLSDLGFDKKSIQKIIKIVISHKFIKPKDHDSQMLIDADTLSDTYLDSFESDFKSYHSSPAVHLQFRSKNSFYTKTAQDIFKKHIRVLEAKSQNNFWR